MKYYLIGAALAALTLMGCDGGERSEQDAKLSSATKASSSASFDCDAVGLGSSDASTMCLNCRKGALVDAANAHDGDASTFATLSLYHPDDTAAQASSFSFRVKAQDGIAYSPGSNAGAIISLPVGDFSAFSIGLATYLNGQLQEVVYPDPVLVANDSSNVVYLGFGSGGSPTTSKVFDSVELQVTELLPWLEEHAIEIFEACSNGGE